MGEVLAILLVYGDSAGAIEQANRLRELLHFSPEDILVIDNASPGNTAQELFDNSKNRFCFISNDKNDGYAAGNNIGIRYALEHGYDYGWILNSDIEWEDSQILKKLISVFEHQTDAATVHPEIMSPEGHIYNRSSVRPSFWDLTLGEFFYSRKGRIIRDLGGYAKVNNPNGCCMLLDVRKICKAGFLDENTFLYHEEPILGERVHMLGYECYLCTEAFVIHRLSESVRTAVDKKRIRRIKQESFGYYLKQYRKYGTIRIGIAKIFYEIKLRLLE